MSRPRPYVLMSVAVSLDGCLDDATEQRLLLSNTADFDRVDEVRAGCDAILVGAETIRRDNPRLVVRDAERRAARVRGGMPEHPVKVTITRSGELDPALAFWQTGGDRLVYTVDDAVAPLRKQLGAVAEVVGLGSAIDPGVLLDDLAARGVRRLMVEGGAQVHTMFLAADVVDEVQVAMAPLLVGDPAAPRLVTGPVGVGRLSLLASRQVGDVVVLRYSANDRRWMRRAIDLAALCPPSETAYSVGAVIVDADGVEIASGYSREGSPTVHAEESALGKLAPDDPRLASATLYSTLEPCSQRASSPTPCVRLIVEAGISRVVVAWREPSLFVANCVGLELLADNGVAVVELPDLAEAAKAMNLHLRM